jgi:tripartite-type tricarboxylate transporter receptor subunit TctC
MIIRMNPQRRLILRLAAGAATLPALTRMASAQGYPARPVRVLVGFPPGGISDITIRLITPWLSERLGQPFVVENRPGAGGNIATEEAIRARPDGYTLLQIGDPSAWNGTLYDNLSFNFARDIAPAASIDRVAFIMVVDASSPAKTGAELIAYAKANPGGMNLASAGPGTASDLYAALFKVMADVNLLTVHYRGVAPALPDLMSGRVDIIFVPIPTALDYIKSGKLRALGVTSTTRSAVLPDVPAIGEFVPGYEAISWVGFGAPANTPPEIIAILNKQTNAALSDPTFKARLADMGAEPFASSPTDFGKFITEYTEKWSKVIRTAGIRAE